MTDMTNYFKNATKLALRQYPWNDLNSIKTYIEGQVKSIQHALLDMEVFEKEPLEKSIRMRKWYIGAVDFMWGE